MKIEITTELMKLADDALEQARNIESDRQEYDGHKWAHCIAEKLPAELVRQHMPSESDIREGVAGALAAAVVRASRRRPRRRNTLLRYCEFKEVIPEELVELPGKKLIPRGQLYAHEQLLLAGKHKAEAATQSERARYEAALAEPFTDWEARELAAGRPRSHLTQMAFWMEAGHISRVLEPREPEGRFEDRPPAE